MLCGLVGLDSRLSKLLLARSSVGVECVFDDGLNLGDLSDFSPLTDLPSSDSLSISCSGPRETLLGDLCTAEVSIVMVGARGLRAGPGDGDGEGDALPSGGGGGCASSDIVGGPAAICAADVCCQRRIGCLVVEVF